MKQLATCCLCMAFAISVIAWAAPSAASDGVIGSIKVVTYPAWVVRDGKVEPAAQGVLLHRQDVLRTGEGGALGVLLRDSSSLSIGPESEMSLEEFDFEPAKGLFSLIARVAKGTMTYLSGEVAKLSPESVAVKTPTATIGIRGTRFAVEVEE